MSLKWAKKAHFGDISYNVFNRRKSSYYMLETLCFTVERGTHNACDAPEGHLNADIDSFCPVLTRSYFVIILD